MKRNALLVTALSVGACSLAWADDPVPSPRPSSAVEAKAIAAAVAKEDGEAAAAAAAKGEAQTMKFAESGDNLAGDTIRFMVNIYGIDPYQGTVPKQRCALSGSKARVSADDGENLWFRFTNVGGESLFDGAGEHADATCPSDQRVTLGIQYKKAKAEILSYDHRLVGWAFGGMVVPFKYYLGGDKKILSSATLAPYLGVKLPFFLGTTITPVASAGLALVPVENQDGNTETNPALSMSLGLLLTSSKSSSFSSGILVGRDFMGKEDRGDDDTVTKPWFSIYLGYEIE